MDFTCPPNYRKTTLILNDRISYNLGNQSMRYNLFEEKSDFAQPILLPDYRSFAHLRQNNATFNKIQLIYGFFNMPYNFKGEIYYKFLTESYLQFDVLNRAYDIIPLSTFCYWYNAIGTFDLPIPIALPSGGNCHLSFYPRIFTLDDIEAMGVDNSPKEFRLEFFVSLIGTEHRPTV